MSLRNDSKRLKEILLKCVQEQGVELSGITIPEKLEFEPAYEEFISKNLHGELYYIKNVLKFKERFGWVKSILMVGINYNTPYQFSIFKREGEKAWISRYAWGSDYHKVIYKKLKKIINNFKLKVDFEFRCKPFVDTLSVPEKVMAYEAGLGFFGKNSLLLNEKFGSFFFLGGIFFDFYMPPDKPVEQKCPENCNLCIKACPQQAIVKPYVVDAKRCNSFLTIENRGEIPPERKNGVLLNVFGCDICQEVCPFNKNLSEYTKERKFYPKVFVKSERKLSFFNPDIESLDKINSEEKFSETFKGSVVKRAGFNGFRRNLKCVKENLKKKRKLNF